MGTNLIDTDLSFTVSRGTIREKEPYCQAAQSSVKHQDDFRPVASLAQVSGRKEFLALPDAIAQSLVSE